jgi:ABC-type Mn2+/Zn2+ transport system ATPase subunit
MNKIIEIKNLNVSFSGKKILNNISFEINKGDIVSLIGKNGT